MSELVQRISFRELFAAGLVGLAAWIMAIFAFAL